MKKHKHYNCIRAYADGWEIERWNHIGNYWEANIFSPIFDDPYEQFRIVPDDDGWLPWYGGECPVDREATVSVLDEGGECRTASAKIFLWGDLEGANIIAYKIVEEAPKKVKMWQWVLQHEKNYLCMTVYFHATREKVEAEYPDYKVVQRADWTEIEVEES